MARSLIVRPSNFQRRLRVETARAHSLPDLKSRIMDFVRRASTEITTHDEKVVPELARSLLAGSTIYVAHTPKASLEEVVRVAIQVQAVGFKASPHLVARRIPSEAALREALARLQDAGVEQVLLVAGDCDTPLGPFQHTLDVVASDVFAQSGIRRIGVAGHPEGIKGVEPERLWQALQYKQDFALGTGVSVHVATQFGFDPVGICDWVRMLGRRGINLPVHVGMAGPTSVTKLLRFAMACGVGASLQLATKNIRAVSSVARMAMTPEEMIPALVRWGEELIPEQIMQPHFFTFGGALATANWIRRVSAGAFDIRSDGKLEVQI
jgi:methylenetetrahydrofolate reductase (NADPH)